MNSGRGVMSKPVAQNDVWHQLLISNEYQQIADLIDQAQTAAVAAGDAQQSALLAAAAHLVASCAQVQQEGSFHQQAYHQTETRRENLEAELKKVLGMVQPMSLAETAVSPTQSSFWQRMTKLWQRGKPPAVAPTGLAPPPLQNGHQVLPETAVAPVLPVIEENGDGERPFAINNSATPQLTIYCLGTFRVYEDEHPVEEWPSRKGKAIFKYLLLHRQQRITKDVLMDAFWPEATADAARNNLNVAIYGLRQALRNGYPEFSHVLFQDDCYFLNPQMGIWVDVEQFELVYERANQMVRRGQTAVAIPDLHAAELLYQGELLAEDRYESWPSTRRQQLQRHYLQLLTHLCNHYFEGEQYASCITFANKLLRVEPCHEATHRLLMRAYARQHQGYLALRQYHQCVELLAEELAVPPDPTTTHLYEAIRSHEPI